MALRAITRAALTTYVSPRDPDYKMVPVPVDEAKPDGPTKLVPAHGEGATRFMVRGLDVFLLAHIYDGSNVLGGANDGSDEVRIHTHVNRSNLEAARFGVEGVENLLDGNGEPVRVTKIKRNVAGRTYEGLSDETLNAIGIETAQELGDEIKRLSRLTKAEVGNSAAA